LSSISISISTSTSISQGGYLLSGQSQNAQIIEEKLKKRGNKCTGNKCGENCCKQLETK